jgi:DNA repair protein RecO (recombination protein O)
MDWTDDGIVLTAQRHGETSAVVQLLTAEHGRHAGLVRGGSASKGRGVYQPGNLVAAHWRGRLPEHLGSYTCELSTSYAAGLLDDPGRLGALTSACAVSEAALPERHPYPALYDATIALLDGLAGEAEWAAIYARWELGLLDELGFGLDLSCCASTGVTEDLVYVSPKSGRAVSREAGAPYRDKLLPLPGFLTGSGETDGASTLAALRLTGHFLKRHVFEPHNQTTPPARDRFVDRFARTPPISGGINGA